MEIRSFVNKEIGEINFNMDKSLKRLVTGIRLIPAHTSNLL